MVNEIEFLPKTIKIGDEWYQPRIYLTAWDKWCIAYKNMCNQADHLCSVVVEPENEPVKIEDTVGYLNEYIGNARTFNDAIDMIIKYVKKYEV